MFLSHAEGAEAQKNVDSLTLKVERICIVNTIAQIIRIDYRSLWLIFNSITQSGLLVVSYELWVVRGELLAVSYVCYPPPPPFGVLPPVSGGESEL